MRKQTVGDTPFVMENYGTKAPFASFLPGIAGIRGIPIWCYYVSRGQGIVSFGTEDKDHAIMEFYPAHVAYRNAPTLGFRTFIRKDGRYFEAFSPAAVAETKMEVRMNTLKIKERNANEGVRTEVEYYTLPTEAVGALVRKITITNEGKEAAFEILDGMPALVPYGVSDDNLKNMTQTAKAWMQAEEEQHYAYYRVRASIKDSTSVQQTENGNFSMGFLPNGESVAPIVDPDVIFGFDTSLGRAVSFEKGGLQAVLQAEESRQNKLPCSFFAQKATLKKGEALVLYEMYGQADSKEILDSFVKNEHTEAYFEKKRQEAIALTKELTDHIATSTASQEFDEYLRTSYMDNVLRGGFPIRLGNKKVFYVYSRKHGDLERDYNAFKVLPEYYSQGNGNFRDVNQNRRLDVSFAPFVGRENIHTFFNLIQLDGCNPLGIEKTTYRIGNESLTPGELYKKLEKEDAEHAEENFVRLLDEAKPDVQGKFLEGYWTDHWTYNLDLIEDYLSIFPEKEEEMLYENTYTWFPEEQIIQRRSDRYVETKKGLRQYNALATIENAKEKQKVLGTLSATLMEKLIVLCSTKFAALDAYGCGLEMEGGKPGWYDALNGLPALFGSSMAETYELERLLTYTIGALERFSHAVSFPAETSRLIKELKQVIELEKEDWMSDGACMRFWDGINDAKECYREKIALGISGEKEKITREELLEILTQMRTVVDHGIEKAKKGREICPTYFAYRVVRYDKDENGALRILEFAQEEIPYFLEGPTRYLKLHLPSEQKEKLCLAVKNSELYDKELSMYKVNAPIASCSFEVGRARAFTPGWLENESIWLHMEYKYLLEMLRSGMYEFFFKEFHHAAIPFMDPERYGRSIYENSSFIASSANPDPNLWGRGFVARLSGSTIEMMSIWKLMMFGKSIFEAEEEELVFSLQPAIPAYLIPEDGTVSATLLGNIQVSYHLKGEGDFFPGNYEVKEIRLRYRDGHAAQILGSEVKGAMAREIREGKVSEVEVSISK